MARWKKRRSGYGGYGTYVSVGRRRQLALQEAADAKAMGEALDPIETSARSIATTHWGRAWCDHIESFHDYVNRLARGRTYVRNGSVYHLAISPGEIAAKVMGSMAYEQLIEMEICQPAVWKRIRKRCSGSIGSLIELLEGRLSSEVMAGMTSDSEGLLPNLRQVKFFCSCPDGAVVCKHIAAVLYGVGARLDERPELLFLLRGVDPAELIDSVQLPGSGHNPSIPATEIEGDLASVFGIELDEELLPPAVKPAKRSKKKGTPAKGPVGGTQLVRRRKLSRKELTGAGVPPGTISSWLQQDILIKTDVRGVYRTTRESRARLESYGD